MKHVLPLFLALICLFLPALGCEKNVTAKITDEELPLSKMYFPPSLTLVCGDCEVRALCPTTQWQRPDGTAVDADGPFVFERWLDGDLEPLPIRPGDTVELRFGCAPDRYSVTAWKAECATPDNSRYEEKTEVKMKDGLFLMPSDGTYLFEVYAEWDKPGKVSGDAFYSFATERAE